MRLAISFLLLSLSSLYVNCLEDEAVPNGYPDNSANDVPKRHQLEDSRKTFAQKHEELPTQNETKIVTNTENAAVNTGPLNLENDNITINNVSTSNISSVQVDLNNGLSSQQTALIQLLTEKLQQLFMKMVEQNVVSQPQFPADSMKDVKNPPNRGPNQLPLIPPLPRNGKQVSNNEDTWDFLTEVSKTVGMYGKSSNIACRKLAICLATDGLDKLVDMTRDKDAMTSSYLATMSTLSGSLLNKDSPGSDGHYEPDCRKRFANECQEPGAES